MTTGRFMQLETIEIQTGDKPQASLIVLHGLGADGHDFAPVCETLDLSDVGPVRFVLPHAPMRPVTINSGYVMRAWYDITGGEGEELAGEQREDELGLRESGKLVHALIEQEKSRGVPASRIVLMGFSQGCAMALLSGLRYGERLAGIAGLSGYLPLAGTTASERAEANADLPIFLAHGTRDPIVPVDRAISSRDALEAIGYQVEWHEYPMQHEVSLQEIDDLKRWVLRVLARG
jgi:phospholipase/carboxylesterase